MSLWGDVAAVVADGVHIAAGDRVSVFMTDTDVAEAVEAFVAEVYRRGAVPQVVAADERYERTALALASDVVLAEPAPLELAALGWSNRHVSFRGMIPPPADQPNATRLALQRHGKGLVSAQRWDQAGWALVRVPTSAWARLIGVDPEQLFAEFAAGCLQDWSAVQSRLKTFCQALDRGRQIVIRDEDTKLLVPYAGRLWLPFAGEANFPDGEVATAPLDEGTSGYITFPGPLWFGGARIEDLHLVFEGGEVVDVSASEGADIAAKLVHSDAGARRVGEFGIGTNAAMSTLTGDLLLDEKILGTAHLALGRAYPECGGVNRSALHWDIVKDLRRSTAGMWVDDTALVLDGVVVGPLAIAVRADGTAEGLVVT